MRKLFGMVVLTCPQNRRKGFGEEEKGGGGEREGAKMIRIIVHGGENPFLTHFYNKHSGLLQDQSEPYQSSDGLFVFYEPQYRQN